MFGDGAVPDLRRDRVRSRVITPRGARFEAAPGYIAAYRIDGSAVRLHEEERTQRAAGGIEPFGCSPQAKEHFLEYFLGQRSIPGHAPRDAEDGARVASPQNFDCLGATMVNLADEGRVVQLVEPAISAQFSGHRAARDRGTSSS